jgi:hypothetical protein
MPGYQHQQPLPFAEREKFNTKAVFAGMSRVLPKVNGIQGDKWTSSRQLIHKRQACGRHAVESH